MKLLSQSAFRTTRDVSDQITDRGTRGLLQAGYIRQEIAGAYSFLPMGLRTLTNIANIVREEMNAIGAEELLLTALGSKEHWTATGRWDGLDVLFRLNEDGERPYALNASHEEILTPLLAEFINSYRHLEQTIGLYQIQTKFRNEPRAKSGILRGREFLMKDLYSFSRDQAALDVFFEEARKAYVRVFDRIGLGEKTHYTFASGGTFSKYSYEFQTELEIGEDIIHICENCGQSHNEEIVEKNFKCVECGHEKARTTKASEVGNIFKLGTKFSDAFSLKYRDETGMDHPVVMGCYGIGVSRCMGVVAEFFADERWLRFPESIAPYTDYLLVQGDHMDWAKSLAGNLEAEWRSVLVDDRDARFGEKIADAELFGMPNIYILSDTAKASDMPEVRRRFGA